MRPAVIGLECFLSDIWAFLGFLTPLGLYYLAEVSFYKRRGGSGDIYIFFVLFPFATGVNMWIIPHLTAD